MTSVTITIPPDVLRIIDDLRAVEYLSRSSWLRREIVLAVRAGLDPPSLKNESARL